MKSELQIKFENANSFIGREPSWIIRNGITLVGLTVAVLLLISWNIRFPKVLTANITITTPFPPIEVLSKVNGKILTLLVNNNDKVEQGQTLVLLESMTEYQSFLRLEKNITEVEKFLIKSNINELSEEILSVKGLGELHHYIEQLRFSLTEYSVFAKSVLLSTRENKVKDIKDSYSSLIQQLKLKQETWRKKRNLEDIKLNKKKLLLRKGIVTEAELQPLQNSLFNTQLIINEVETEIELYKLKIKESEQGLIEFRAQQYELLQLKRAKAYNDYISLTTELENWKKKYLIIAPAKGIVSFHKFWGQGQNVGIGDSILTIVRQHQDPIGKLFIDIHGAVNILPGQKVKVELYDYPSIEFGALEGIVKSKSILPGRNGYLVDVQVPKKLETTHKKSIPIAPELHGRASIIIEEKRLLERYLDKVIYIFKSRT